MAQKRKRINNEKPSHLNDVEVKQELKQEVKEIEKVEEIKPVEIVYSLDGACDLFDELTKYCYKIPTMSDHRKVNLRKELSRVKRRILGC